MLRSNTIEFRLTLWGTGINLLVCLVVCGVLYAGVWYSLHKEVDNFLVGEIHEFMGVVAQHQYDFRAAEQNIRPHLGSRSRGDLSFRVLDTTGSVLLASHSEGSFFGPVRVVGEMEFETLPANGRRFPFRICSMPVTGPDGARYVAQTSYALDRVESSLSLLRTTSAVALALAAVLALLAGRVLAARSLAPLHSITVTARQISASRLSDRLPQSHNGDELDHLAGVLNDLLGRVETYVRRIQQFTADVSHELRSPLAALKGNAEVALSRERSAAEFKEVLEHSVEHYERLGKITEDLLLLARVDAGEDIFRREPLELGQAVRDVVDLFSPLATECGLRLVFEENASASLVGDAGRLRQVFANLIDNAIKYTPAPGEVRVSLDCENGKVRVRVADTGVGIAAEDLPRIFDRFYRADRARSRSRPNNDGVGLGLSICRSIVEAHHGHIEVSSSAGQGTVIDVKLPRAS